MQIGGGSEQKTQILFSIIFAPLLIPQSHYQFPRSIIVVPFKAMVVLNLEPNLRAASAYQLGSDVVKGERMILLLKNAVDTQTSTRQHIGTLNGLGCRLPGGRELHVAADAEVVHLAIPSISQVNAPINSGAIYALDICKCNESATNQHPRPHVVKNQIGNLSNYTNGLIPQWH